MKTLYLLRHAKSSWDDPDVDDFSRPLNERGEKDAPRMGKRLKERNIVLDLIYSSSALRALTTAKIVAGTMNYPEASIHADRSLYHADELQLWKYVRHFAEPSNNVMIVGHNPGLTLFANEAMDDSIDDIPTCGLLAIEFNVDEWKDVRKGAGKTGFFDFPKNQQG